MSSRLSSVMAAFALIVAVGAAVGMTVLTGTANAQDQEPKLTQLKLTDGHIKGFISAQKDLAGMADKLQAASESDKPDPALTAELEALAKKHGFKDFQELDDVAANITMILAGMDPKTGEFTDSTEAIKREIEEVKADKSISEADRKQILEEMNDALKATGKVEFPSNIELVRKHRAEIEAAMQ